MTIVPRAVTWTGCASVVSCSKMSRFRKNFSRFWDFWLVLGLPKFGKKSQKDFCPRLLLTTWKRLPGQVWASVVKWFLQQISRKKSVYIWFCSKTFRPLLKTPELEQLWTGYICGGCSIEKLFELNCCNDPLSKGEGTCFCLCVDVMFIFSFSIHFCFSQVYVTPMDWGDMWPCYLFYNRLCVWVVQLEGCFQYHCSCRRGWNRHYIPLSRIERNLPILIEMVWRFGPSSHV